jgi:hypothetical protein
LAAANISEEHQTGVENFHMKTPVFVCGILLFGLAVSRTFAAGEETFATPDDAVKALATAAAAKDTNTFHAIFGPGLHSLVSADAVEASNRFVIFAKRIAEKTNLEYPSDDRAILDIGYDSWPFPIPLVRQNDQWHFDTDAGREEVLNRRIGENELGTIRVCQTYVEAQREYAGKDRTGDGVLQYAQFLRSATGRHNGLYWHAEQGEEVSPLGPLIAAAHAEGYRHESKILTDTQKPYHGYYFKILTRQGRHAAGGKYNYIINGRMIAGFALVAWPAEWDNTGIMTFIVNQDGKVYEKNLGLKTSRLAPAMTAFDPDSSWKACQ